MVIIGQSFATGLGVKAPMHLNYNLTAMRLSHNQSNSPDKYTGASVDNPTCMRALVLYVSTSLAWFEMVSESLIAQACVWIQARPSKRN